MLEYLDALILAGGLGTRLRKAVPYQPKVIADINGRPFIAFLLDQLSSTGISRVTLCTGYKSEQVEGIVGSRYRTMDVLYSTEKTPLGTGGALRYAAGKLFKEWILVMNGDSFIECNLLKYVDWHLNSNVNASMVVASVSDARRYGSVELGEDQNIIAFREKEEDKQGFGYINAGVYLIRKSVIEELEFGEQYSLEHEVVPRLLASGLYGYLCDGRFIDIGTEESYIYAKSFFGKFEQ